MLREKVLELLFEEEITQKELTSRLRASRSRMSEVLKSLERQKLITRKRVSERTVLVSINHETTLRIGILRSSEYFHVVSTLRKLEKSIPYRIRVYENSLEALKELMTGSEDMVASPLISGYFFNLIDRSIRPVAGVASGGSGLIKRKEHGTIGTTPLSKMDKESREFGGFEQVYYKSVGEIIRAYKKREIDAAQIWEPFLSINEGMPGASKGLCCCLFVRGKTGGSIASFVEEYLRDVRDGPSPETRREIGGALSKLIGVKAKDVLDSIGSYRFTTTVSKSDLENQIASFGLPLVREVENFLEGTPKIPI